MPKSAPTRAVHRISEPIAHPGVRLINRADADLASEGKALIAGLFAMPAVIPPKYFYDALGCALFDAICALPEYYPTRTERAILTVHRDEIARTVGTRKQWVDLGAGDCAKSALLLPSLQARRYIAVDIAADAIVPALSRLAPALPGVELVGVVTDFSRRLDLGGALDEGPVTFFYPGSSIGNFTPAEAWELLLRIKNLCRPGGGLLIGVDTKKEKARLDAAYDDALGVTAAFNRNILNHVNALAACDFDPAAYAHVAFYDETKGRVEIYLEARFTQRVRIGGGERVFAAGERIHTENSYKYAPAEFEQLLRAAGFTALTCWQDPAGDFAVFYAE